MATGPEERAPIRVLVVDDDENMRDLLRLTLELDPDLTLVGEAVDGIEAVTAAEQTQPDVIVLDVMMPGRDGLDALPEICSVSPNSKVIVFTAYATVPIVQRALERGASLVLEKTVPQNDVATAIRDLATTS